jgi:hypothetical protein
MPAIKNDRINSMSDSLTIRDKKITKLQARIAALEEAVERLRIYVGNPSAWEYYDDAMSERIRGLLVLLDK